MKTPILMIAMTLGAGLSMAPAFAQGRETPDFATMDTNSDGQITVEDFEAAHAARFAQADTDGDGVLSEAELVAQAETRAAGRAAEMVAKMLERLDENADGVLQPDEIEGHRGDRMARTFDRVDTDEDGAISEEEYEAAADARGHRGGRDGRGHGGGKGKGERPGRG